MSRIYIYFTFFCKGTELVWKKFLKPAVVVAAPFIGVGVGAKTKNPQVAHATTFILESV